MKKFGFWIIPENNFYQELEKVIQKYGKKYNSPIFTPHMSLHGVVESTDKRVVEIVEKAANKIKPFKIEVGNVEFSTTYFQCVFVRTKTNAKLLDAHLTIRKGFNFQEKHVFMPHASLVYGDFDMETREKISQEIKLLEKNFKARKITIVRADSSKPKDWEIIKQVKL